MARSARWPRRTPPRTRRTATASSAEAAALAERALGGGELSPNRPAFYMAVYTLLVCERFEVAHRRLSDALRLARRRGTRVTVPVLYSHRA